MTEDTMVRRADAYYDFTKWNPYQPWALATDRFQDGETLWPPHFPNHTPPIDPSNWVLEKKGAWLPDGVVPWLGRGTKGDVTPQTPPRGPSYPISREQGKD